MSSSRSLTAVTSFVDVVREKTVLVLKLNVKGCQRVAVPIAIFVCCLLANGLLVAAAATNQMVQVARLKRLALVVNVRLIISSSRAH